MNGERLYINGIQLELNNNSKIAYTMQVNDIASVTSRQANFTKSIEIPRTPKNIKILEYLGVVGNVSVLPYQKNEINYYVNNDCIIFNGWGVISETGSDKYHLHIYDGVIDFFKIIENKNLGELELNEINHIKSLSAVTASWNDANGLNFKYILADYNGKAKYASGTKFNIDYIVPSAKVSYLFDKIFEKYDMTYSGDIFQSDDFQNLYMTYPKGVAASGELEDIYFNANCAFEQFSWIYDGITSLYMYVDGTEAYDNLNDIVNAKHFKVNETGSYKIEISGEICPIGNSNELAGVQCNIWIGKNSIPIGNANNVSDLTLLRSNVGGSYTSFYDCSAEKVITLNALDSLCIVIRQFDGKNLRYVNEKSSNPFKFKISKIEGSEIDFSTTFIDFKTKDFISEITNRYGLTIFKDKYTQNYQFLTLDERINQADKVDWSEKLVVKGNEKYIYGDYAQNNIFKYKYNDANSNYNDGYIKINNVNLTDEKDVINSKIYSPEKELNTVDFPYNSHIYKLWNKEVDENEGTQEVKYKELDKRFYFIKSQDYHFGSPTVVGSEYLIEQQTIPTATTVSVESYSGVSYSEVIKNYYSEYSNILNNSKIISVKLNLNETDISTFDFKNIYYFKQFGEYFLINKISNWQPNKLTDVELLRINYKINRPDLSGTTGIEYITITGQTFSNADGFTRTINVHFDTNITTPYLKVMFTDSPTTPVTILNQSPYSFLDIVNPLGGFYSLNLTSMDGSIISNPSSWWG
jgi:hypothetical protein